MSFLFFLCCLYLFCANVSYLFWVRRYMKKNGIKNVNETTGDHAIYINRLWLRMMGFWWYDLYTRLK